MSVQWDEEKLSVRFDTILSNDYEDVSCPYSLDDVRENILYKLDYDLKYADDRNNLVKKLLSENEWIYDLISTKKMMSNHIKSKNDFLTEDTEYGRIMDALADYIAHPKFRNKDEEEEFKKKQEEIKQKKINEKISKKKDYFNKKKMESIKKKEKNIDSTYMMKDNKVNDFGTKKLQKKIFFKQTITDQDIKDFKEIRELNNYILKVGKELGYKQGLKGDQIKKLHQQIAKEKGRLYLKAAREAYRDLSSEILKIKEMLRGTIYFKRLEKSHTAYDFDNDTGYVNEKGEYILVSENKIELKKKEHLAALIKYYVDLKEKYKHKFNSSMWANLWVLDELIAESELAEDEKWILNLNRQDINQREIAEECTKEFEKDYKQWYISSVLGNHIPSKVHKLSLDKYDDWLYTYKIKGKYKKCTKCGEIKLISNNRYFSPDKRNADKFHSICRKCR